ncbi:MAG: tetratricopeptide repeat protein [Xenococcaceae cyanobacterium]
MKILILASNPRRDLNLEGEIRHLQEVIERSRNREDLEVEVGLAVRPEDLQGLFLKHEPEIVHFCGHGTGKPGLVLQDDAGLEKLVSTDALSNLFELCSEWVKCVLLNACYSEVQANAMVQHINYAIGMNHEIRDDAAIAFATGFYQALGYGQPIGQAYRFGCNAIQLQISGNSTVRSVLSEEKRKLEIATTVEKVVIPEHLKPVLKIKPNLTTSIDKSMPDGKEKLLPSTKLDLQSYIDKALEKEITRRQAHPELQEDLAEQSIPVDSPSSSPKKTHKLLIGSIFGVILATVSLIVISSLSNRTEMTSEDFFVRGADKHDRNDYRGAIEDYTQALEIDRNHGDAYYDRGHARFELGDHKGAIEDFTQAIAIEGNDGHAYYDRGKARFKLGDYKGAIEDFTQAIAIEGNDGHAYYDRGKARFELRDRQGAIEDYNKAAELFQQQGDPKWYQETQEELNKIKEIKPRELKSTVEVLKVYANSTQGTPFENRDNKSVQVRFEVDSNSRWLAIPKHIDNVRESAQGFIAPKGNPHFRSNDNMPCPRYPLGSLVVKSDEGECLAHGEQDSFELAPGETVYFLMNDVYGRYEDNEGYINVQLSR